MSEIVFLILFGYLGLYFLKFSFEAFLDFLQIVRKEYSLGENILFLVGTLFLVVYGLMCLFVSYLMYGELMGR